MKRFNEKLKLSMRTGKNKPKEAEPEAEPRDAVSPRKDRVQASRPQGSEIQPGVTLGAANTAPQADVSEASPQSEATATVQLEGDRIGTEAEMAGAALQDALAAKDQEIKALQERVVELEDAIALLRSDKKGLEVNTSELEHNIAQVQAQLALQKELRQQDSAVSKRAFRWTTYAGGAVTGAAVGVFLVIGRLRQQGRTVRS